MKLQTLLRWLLAITTLVILNACGGGGGGAINHAPVALEKNVTTSEDVEKAIVLTGSDEDGDSLRLFSVTVSPSHGTLGGTPPNVVYRPDANYHGEDTFKFKVNDGTVDSREARVRIVINSVNDAPTASNITCILDVDKSTIGLNWKTASSASDIDGDALSASVATQGSHGTFAIIGDNLTYFRTSESNETDHGVITVSDGRITKSITVDVEALFWQKISSRAEFSVALKSDGTIWGWGGNVYGQLADGTTIDRDHPVQEQTHMTDWVDVAVGTDHTVAIKQNGTLWSWGRNNHGQLGNNSHTDAMVPVQENSHATHWVKAVAGREFTIAKTTSSVLMSWGYNGYQTLGINEVAFEKLEPVEVAGGISEWADMAAGNYHVIALKTNGEIWSWGYNSNGQLGNNDTTTQKLPVQEHLGDNDWTKIYAGAYHSFAIKSNNHLYSWGNNGNGQLGVGDYADKHTPTLVGLDTWQDIGLGEIHSMGIKYDGTLWGWGNNKSAQRGDSSIYNRNTPIQIGTDHDWKSVEASRTTTLAQKNNTVLYGWGYDKYGQLGNKHTDTLYAPTHIQTTHTWKKISIGYTHVLAIRDDGTLWGWGENGSGQLGNGSFATGYTFEPVQEEGEYEDWIEVAAGTFFSVGLRSDGSLWTWGSDAQGKLGRGSVGNTNVPTQVGSESWIHICAGDNHAAAIRSGTHKLYTWGRNSNGQLGVGDFTNRNTPTQDSSGLTWASVSCGPYNTAAIQIPDNGSTLYTWGRNSNGQLGIGNTDTKNVPTPVSDGWQSVAIGKSHMIGIKTNDALYGWGHNDKGQVGNSSLADAAIPNLLAMGPWGIVAAGGDTSMAMKGDDTVWVWGDNLNATHAINGRQIPYGKTPQEIEALGGTQATNQTDLSIGIWSAGLVKHDGSLWEWGNNDHKELSRDWAAKTPKIVTERH